LGLNVHREALGAIISLALGAIIAHPRRLVRRQHVPRRLRARAPSARARRARRRAARGPHG
jgi:hypothetical protein